MLDKYKSEYLIVIEGKELKLFNIATQTCQLIDADPFNPPEKMSGFESAYWSSCGNKLVISVGEVRGGCSSASVGILELWILNKVW